MKYLLDSNVCIQYLNQRSEKIIQRLQDLSDIDIVVCSIVKAELFYGAMRTHNPAKTLQKQQEFLGRFVSLYFDDQCALIYGEIRSKLAAKGTPIGNNDLHIAAIAMANNLTLITHNTREFSRIDNLKLEDWEI
ncbi:MULTISPECIES: type II toxin-antitoxin system VapC family toxin [Aphanizomenonaceae]|jgi:tRNA(fMet)-specific endonuclease VapC|uniref:Ribonuclease VapC n=1 Tax=Dolichospermum heterosporum TAC447 TaxID=747523 RepID=A0ABY5LWT0_9CYAN|nr:MULTISPECIES: type II toxin-antitoxin system VapC family toxin [Aphanizomenonaceae]MBE9256553.1 type II toxin-antitoxin system VapC family toxin [Dolichospermum sp. LEGE 00246]MDK2412527.1 type II toxin-antitoxin system VapC family toxin [Aphanizomenon sp. 202]MDK2462420.1 type II toxin-antitoxin system VapC family toxin [Aphanizomenon sp. PH219]UUO15212.1 type II toxin-antitoxin system VapC family toxin [Dolichospermum heterosporum TAC447]